MNRKARQLRETLDVVAPISVEIKASSIEIHICSVDNGQTKHFSDGDK